MVIDLLFVALLLASTVLLVSGRPLNIHVTHTHKAENEVQPTTVTTPEQDEEQLDVKDVAEFIQDYLGVLNEK
jgi:hypothetical protein